MTDNTGPTVVIDEIGGSCPVQAEGTIDGVPFYFRSRGARWSISVCATDLMGNPEFYHEEPYGEWPDAGWISEEEARAFIEESAVRFAESRRTASAGTQASASA